MKTTPDTRPLVERITQGPAEILDVYPASFHNETPPRKEDVWEIQCREAGNTPCYATSQADAELIIDAFNTAHRTRRTPSELASERQELLDALKDCLGFYGESTGYYHVRREDREKAKKLYDRLTNPPARRLTEEEIHSQAMTAAFGDHMQG